MSEGALYVVTKGARIDQVRAMLVHITAEERSLGTLGWSEPPFASVVVLCRELVAMGHAEEWDAHPGLFRSTPAGDAAVAAGTVAVRPVGVN